MRLVGVSLEDGFGELSNDRPLVESRIDMRPSIEQTLLGVIHRETAIFHEPADGDRRAACPPRLTVNVDLLIRVDVFLNKLHRLFNVLQSRMREVGGGDA